MTLPRPKRVTLARSSHNASAAATPTTGPRLSPDSHRELSSRDRRPTHRDAPVMGKTSHFHLRKPLRHMSNARTRSASIATSEPRASSQTPKRRDNRTSCSKPSVPRHGSSTTTSQTSEPVSRSSCRSVCSTGCGREPQGALATREESLDPDMAPTTSRQSGIHVGANTNAREQDLATLPTDDDIHLG
jgi:hypothetical protein